MRRLFGAAALAVLLFVASVTACCYSLASADLRGAQTPVYTWWLDTLSAAPVAPSDCAGTVVGLDTHTTPTQCRLVSVSYRPMVSSTLQQQQLLPWRIATLELAQQVLFVQPCVGFGPFVPGEAASRLLLHELSDAWIRVELACEDSSYTSCATFGLHLRDDASNPRLESEFVPSTQEDRSCVRVPTQSAPPTPSHAPTPSYTPTPSATPLPSYGTVFTVHARLTGADAVLAFRMGLSYDTLALSNGTDGAQFCAGTVRSSPGGVVIAAFAPLTSPSRSRATRDAHRAQAFHAYQSTQTQITVTVLWDTGGWCRVVMQSDGTVSLLGCRIVVDAAHVYDRIDSATVERLEDRTTPLCSPNGVLADSGGGGAAPSASPAPATCYPDLYYVDHDHALVTLRNATHYAEAIVRVVECSDGGQRVRLHRVSSLVGLVSRVSYSCSITSPLDDRTRAECTDGSELVTVTATCDTIASSTLSVQRRCTSDRGALLLL